MLVPSPLAVGRVNWISPVAPLTGLATFGLNVSPVSKAITAMRWLGSTPRSLAISRTFARKAGETFFPQTRGSAEAAPAERPNTAAVKRPASGPFREPDLEPNFPHH